MELRAREGSLLAKFRLLALVLGFFIFFTQPLHPTTTSAQASQSANPTAEASNQLSQLSTYLAAKDSAPLPVIAAQAYVLVNAQNGEVLIQKNATEEVPIASTTKMTTAIVARQLLPLDKVATVSPKTPYVEGSKAHLVANEQITVHNLLKALLIPSGNDAAITLAETYTGKIGDYQAFVDKMNEFAQRNQLDDTHFADPAGLSDDLGHSSARDLAQIGRILLDDPILASIVATPAETITDVSGQTKHQLDNSNRLIKDPNPFYMPGVFGIKTGNTDEAGHCLVSAYHLHNLPGQTVIGVVLHTASNDNSASAAEMKKLFAWADQNLAIRQY